MHAWMPVCASLRDAPHLPHRHYHTHASCGSDQQPAAAREAALTEATTTSPPRITAVWDTHRNPSALEITGHVSRPALPSGALSLCGVPPSPACVCFAGPEAAFVAVGHSGQCLCAAAQLPVPAQRRGQSRHAICSRTPCASVASLPHPSHLSHLHHPSHLPHPSHPLTCAGTGTIQLVAQRDWNSPGASQPCQLLTHSTGAPHALCPLTALAQHAMASAHLDGTVCVWDLRAGADPAMRLQGHGDGVSAVAGVRSDWDARYRNRACLVSCTALWGVWW